MKTFLEFDGITAWKDDKHHLVMMVLLSILIKAILLIYSDIVNDDAVRYANSAHELLQGHLAAAFSHEVQLFYALILGIVNLLVNDWRLAGQLISLTFLTLTIIPLYYLTRHFFGARAAFLAVLAFNLIPALNELVSEVVKEAPYLFCMTTALYCACRAQPTARFSSHIPILCFSILACLFRFEGVVLLGLYLLWLLFLAGFRPAWRAHACRGLLLYAGLLVVCLGGVTGLLLSGALSLGTLETICLRLSRQYLKGDPFGDYRAIYEYLKFNVPYFPGSQWSNDFFEIARHWMPAIYLLGLLQVIAVALFPVYLIPLGIGLWSMRWPERGAGLPLATALAYTLMAYFFIMTRNFLSERYILVVIVLLLPVVGCGYEKLWAGLRKLPCQPAVLALTAILFLALPTYRTFAGVADQKTELRQAGEWLKSTRDLVANRLATSDERVPFYADLFRDHYEILPVSELSRPDRYAILHGCSLLVVDISLRERSELPNYEDFDLIREFPGKNRVVLIYEKKSQSQGD